MRLFTHTRLHFLLCAALCAPSLAMAEDAPDADAGEMNSRTLDIKELTQILADRDETRYILSKDAVGRQITLYEPHDLEKLKKEELRTLYSSVLTGMGLVMQVGETQTRIDAAKGPDGKIIQIGSAEGSPFVVAMSDVSLVGINRVDRVERSLKELGASVVMDYRSSTMLVVHERARGKEVFEALEELQVQPVVMSVPADNRKGLLTVVDAVLSFNSKSAKRTWRKTGGGGIVASGGSKRSSKAPRKSKAKKKK